MNPLVSPHWSSKRDVEHNRISKNLDIAAATLNVVPIVCIVLDEQILALVAESVEICRCDAELGITACLGPSP